MIQYYCVFGIFPTQVRSSATRTTIRKSTVREQNYPRPSPFPPLLPPPPSLRVVASQALSSITTLPSKIVRKKSGVALVHSKFRFDVHGDRWEFLSFLLAFMETEGNLGGDLHMARAIGAYSRWIYHSSELGVPCSGGGPPDCYQLLIISR